MFKKIFLVLLSFSLCGMANSSELGSLKGIKWKQELPERGGSLNDKVYGRLAKPKRADGTYKSVSSIVNELSASGIEAVTFRIDVAKRFVDENGNGSGVDEMNTYHAEVALAINKLENKGIKTFLWGRTWLTKNNNQAVFNLFDLFLKNQPVARGQLDGIGITEIQLSSFDEIKTRAKWIANKFNVNYNNWLKSRAFMVPGLHNGLKFTDVNKSDNFHEDIADFVGEFAFVVKAFNSHKGYLDYGIYMNEDILSVEERKTWLVDKMKLQDLVDYQNSSTNTNVNNIIFWGDSGDAMSVMHPLAATAIHDIIYGPDSKGAFFYAPAADEDMELTRTIAKSLFMLDRSDNSYYQNDIQNGKWVGRVGVWDQYFGWFNPVTGY
jgi:hypothetical protein